MNCHLHCSLHQAILLVSIQNSNRGFDTVKCQSTTCSFSKYYNFSRNFSSCLVWVWKVNLQTLSYYYHYYYSVILNVCMTATLSWTVNSIYTRLTVSIEGHLKSRKCSTDCVQCFTASDWHSSKLLTKTIYKH